MMSKSKAHLRDLEKTFLYSSGIDIQDSDKLLLSATESCLAFIKARIRTPYPVLEHFFRRNDWSKTVEIKGLFSAYVKAGHIGVDDLMSDGRLPLEEAITKANFSVLESLLENGADSTKVPSETMARALNSSLTRLIKADNIFDFINICHTDQKVAVELSSTVRSAIMRRQIDLAARDVQPSSSSPLSPRRRMGVL